MREQTGHLFDLYDTTPGSWLVVTTNGCVDGDGSLVMGAGVAGAAKKKFPGIERALGDLVTRNGNVPVALRKVRVLTWPTKPGPHLLNGRTHAGWMCMSRVTAPECQSGVKRLVAASGLILISLINELGIDGPIFTPRPGCGLGGLDWNQVRPWMADKFDDRFVVIDPVR